MGNRTSYRCRRRSGSVGFTQQTELAKDQKDISHLPDGRTTQFGQGQHKYLQVHILKSAGTVAILLCFGLILSPTNDALAAKKRFVAIGTGGPTGVYFAASNAIYQMKHKEAAEG